MGSNKGLPIFTLLLHQLRRSDPSNLWQLRGGFKSMSSAGLTKWRQLEEIIKILETDF
jgi:hypothetical protein